MIGNVAPLMVSNHVPMLNPLHAFHFIDGIGSRGFALVNRNEANDPHEMRFQERLIRFDGAPFLARDGRHRCLRMKL